MPKKLFLVQERQVDCAPGALPIRANLCDVGCLLWDESELYTVRFNVGAFDQIEGIKAKKSEPPRFPLVLMRQGRILPTRIDAWPFDHSRCCSDTFSSGAMKPSSWKTPCCCIDSWRPMTATHLSC